MKARSAAAALCLIALAAANGPAAAADKLRAGKAVQVSFPMSMLELGTHEGIFAKYNVDLEITAFTGDAKLQQAFAADAIDVGLGSGPAMAFEVKGSPTIAVAVFAGPPGTIAVATTANSPLNSVADLKGKTLAISTTGSLTEWLVKRLSVHEGWGPDGIKTIALGAGAAMNGALFTHQVDAMMTGTENAYILADKGQARVLAGAETFVPDFMTHVVFARKDLVASNPDLVARFLKGFFASIRYAKANKAATAAFMAPLLNESPAVFEKIYDHEAAILSDDGRFDPKAVAILKDSFIDMGILDRKPGDDQLFTTRFTPVKP
ncbi:MAG TPA: ABC transporter substrate-binding protein [Stellaceae bacterium]|jgi:ABC-type nitrate/sulfonate/bicarbonate transport system substrate-binding protein